MVYVKGYYKECKCTRCNLHTRVETLNHITVICIKCLIRETAVHMIWWLHALKIILTKALVSVVALIISLNAWTYFSAANLEKPRFWNVFKSWIHRSDISDYLYIYIKVWFLHVLLRKVLKRSLTLIISIILIPKF